MTPPIKSGSRFRLTIWHLVTVVLAVSFGCFVLTAASARNVIGALVSPAPILALIVFLLPCEGAEPAPGRSSPGGEPGATPDRAG
jgi:hypothetical protein